MIKNIGSLLDTRQPPRTISCDTHGPYTSTHYFGAIWSKCPECERPKAAQVQAQAAAQERADALAAWQQRIGDSGIPERFQDRTLKNYVAETPEQKKALAFATAYADGFDEVLRTGRSALFIGHIGTGKTHLAAGIGLRLMHRDCRTVLFMTVKRAIRRVKDTWSRSSRETESEAVAALASPDLLILDEVGVQFGSETERQILFDVINERYEKRKPTLMLSNLPLDEVQEYLGERIFDRLREGGGQSIPFDWESWRGRVA
ncbi:MULTISPECIES: ATP-binding protein [Giesbergeria]|uniref:ATP-binding protein n=1 Tax=Giesbergeria sinuosa TaxID=80883 RepID=A0ABV9QA32_9BURK